MRSVQFTMAILFMLWMISYYSLDKTWIFMVLKRGAHMCQSMPICTLNIFYDPSVYDNVDGLESGHASCVPMLVPVPGEWSNHWGGNTESSSNNDCPSKDVLITRPVPQGAETSLFWDQTQQEKQAMGEEPVGFLSVACLDSFWLVGDEHWSFRK